MNNQSALDKLPSNAAMLAAHLALSTLNTMLIGLLVDGSLNDHVVDVGGRPAMFIGITVSALSMLMLLDVTVLHGCRWMARRRHLLLMLLAIGNGISAAAVMWMYPYAWLVASRMVTDALFCSVFALRDLLLRHRQ